LTETKPNTLIFFAVLFRLPFFFHRHLEIPISATEAEFINKNSNFPGMDTFAVFYLMYWKCLWAPTIYKKHTNVVIPINLK